MPNEKQIAAALQEKEDLETLLGGLSLQAWRAKVGFLAEKGEAEMLEKQRKMSQTEVERTVKAGLEKLEVEIS